MTSKERDWTESRPEVVELTEALQLFFRERNADLAIAHQALINMLVMTTARLDGHNSQSKANKKLAVYFKDAVGYLAKDATPAATH